MPRKPNPELLDQDAPEATQEWFAKARPALDKPKEHVNIRLDADIVGAFKGSGAGWQTRLNNALRGWLKSHPVQKA
ncbi:MAG: BrnA antitoxin family protein [Aquabacterium sp.]|nr:BrnA antitoxin family protein [Aquabacterium sp.]